jgi:hypothetical protein
VHEKRQQKAKYETVARRHCHPEQREFHYSYIKSVSELYRETISGKLFISQIINSHVPIATQYKHFPCHFGYATSANFWTVRYHHEHWWRRVVNGYHRSTQSVTYCEVSGNCSV